MLSYGYDVSDLGKNADEMPARDKLEEDRIFINLMCLELHIFIRVMTIQPPATDEISRYFRDIETEQHFHLWLVFAFQLMVDLKWVLRAHMHHGLQDLTAASSRGTESVRQCFRESSEVSFPSNAFLIPTF